MHTHHVEKHLLHHTRKGFSLLELAVALGLSGIILSSIWQLNNSDKSTVHARNVAGQVLAVSSAAYHYVADNRSSLLVSLPSIDSTGEILVSDMQASGDLPSDFVNQNEYAQTYRVFVKREDGGAAGPDSDDKLVTLVVSDGGVMIADTLGNEIVNALGAGGGFIYSDSSTTMRGLSGGWQINFSGAGWSTLVGYTPSVGHVGVLTNLLPSQGIISSSGDADELKELDDSSTNYSTGAMFVGQGSGNSGSLGTDNTSLGMDSLDSIGSGSRNVAAGTDALQALLTGNDNVAFGYRAGSTITTGSNNIMIGANTQPSASTASNELNIGNFLYGNMSTQQLALGTNTLTTGVSFDLGFYSDSMRGAIGTTSQRPTCNASLVGAQRWNVSTQSYELCSSTGWKQLYQYASNATTQIPYPNSGYFVMTETKWDGNLGGIAGAHAKCLNELTTKTNWRFHDDALAAGLLTSAHVKAFLCYTMWAPCVVGNVNTIYYFSRVGDTAVGGASFSTSSSGYGPNNNASWAAYNYFGIMGQYWTAMVSASSTAFNGSFWGACNGWVSNSSSDLSVVGITTSITHGRYSAGSAACNLPQRLLCWVNP